MQNKRPVRRSRAEALDDVRAEFQRMRPAELFDYAHGKIAIEYRLLARVVVAYRGYAAEQVLQAAPEEARILGNRQLLANGGFAGMVDVASPSSGVGIKAASQARVEVELQMI